MAERLRNGLPVLFLAGLIIASIGCRLSLQEENRVTTLNKTYQIDSQTLLKSLTNGDTNVFLLMIATPPVYPDNAREPVEWTQADYFFVAETFFHSVQGETMNGWKLSNMSFRGDCYEIDAGFQGGNFGFFRSVTTQAVSSRETKNLFINPKENIVTILEDIYTPELNEWNSINLAQVKISANEALQIAEDNGGVGIRKQVKDDCAVLAEIDAERKSKDWLVTYFWNGSLFDMYIDAETGEYRILR